MRLPRSLLPALAAAVIAAAPLTPQAQAYPVRPVVISVGFAPGGNADAVARILAREMAQGLGQPLVVEPKPGAGGNLAATTVAKATPDGYTLLMATGGHPVSGALYKSLQYKTVESFAPVSLVTTFPFVLATRADSPHDTLRTLMAMAKADPGRVTFGTAGVGTTQHLTGELLGSMGRMKLTHVPYKGDAAALVGLLAGETDLVVAGPTALLPHIKSGKLRPIAVTGARRFALMPDVPTVAEAGVAGFDVQSWLGLVTTAGTPAPVVERLHAEVVRALQQPGVRSAIEGLGSEPRSSTPAEMRNRIASELRQWTRVIEQAQIERQ
jgi:tripartite-type tricarboxylate transporter receptor subunit TctC